MKNEEHILTVNEEVFLDYQQKLKERNSRALNYLTDKDSLEKLQASVKELQDEYDKFQKVITEEIDDYKQGQYQKKMDGIQKAIRMNLDTIAIVTKDIEDYHITNNELNRLDEDNKKINQLAIQLFGNQLKEIANEKNEKKQRIKRLDKIHIKKIDEIMEPIIELITKEHQIMDIFALPQALMLSRKIVELLQLHGHYTPINQLVCDCVMYLTSNRTIRDFKSSGDAIRTLIKGLKILENWLDIGDFRRALQEYMGISFKYRLYPFTNQILIDYKGNFLVSKI